MATHTNQPEAEMAPTSMNSPTQLPVIDFSAFFSGSKTQQRQMALKLLTNFEEFGQVVLINHGISNTNIADIFQNSKNFFTLSEDLKNKYKFDSVESNRGYLGRGSERLSYGMTDIKETFEIGKESETQYPNKWPNKEVPEFRKTMLQFFNDMDSLHLKILRCIEIALNLEEGVITNKCGEQHENLRLLHYPPCHSSEVDESLKGTKRCNAHTDYGTITLLLQDGAGGLQLQLKNGEWMDVEPVKNGIVVQVADMLERWTNGLLPAARHRVVSPKVKRKGDSMLPERYSVAFFCNPDKHASIEALDNTFDKVYTKKYKPFKAVDFLNMRLRATL